MSFEQQERVLFDLLFDHNLRKAFCSDQISALKQYDLDDHELEDFKSIRPDALKLDAAMRANLILSHICKSFPISFSISSSFPKGLEILNQLIDVETMSSKPIERATVFGNRLGQHYPNFAFSSDQERAIATAILEAELGMAWTSASLKQVVLQGGEIPQTTPLEQNWLNRAIKLAPYVSASVLPQSYAKIKQRLCKVEDDCLWRHLNKTALAVSVRKKTLQTNDPRLLVARAQVQRMSKCEPVIEYATMELSEGFAPLFQHVNGTMSVAQILAQLRQIGAQEQMLNSIQLAFEQMLQGGMLELDRAI